MIAGLLFGLAALLTGAGVYFYAKADRSAMGLEGHFAFWFPMGAVVLLIVLFEGTSGATTRTYTICFRDGEKIVALRNDNGKDKTFKLSKVNRTQDPFNVGDEVNIITDCFGNIKLVTDVSREGILRKGNPTPRGYADEDVGDAKNEGVEEKVGNDRSESDDDESDGDESDDDETDEGD